MNRHEFNRPKCPEMNLELLGTHSNGTRFFRCKNCGYAAPERYFIKEFDMDGTLRQVLQEPW